MTARGGKFPPFASDLPCSHPTVPASRRETRKWWVMGDLRSTCGLAQAYCFNDGRGGLRFYRRIRLSCHFRLYVRSRALVEWWDFCTCRGNSSVSLLPLHKTVRLNKMHGGEQKYAIASGTEQDYATTRSLPRQRTFAESTNTIWDKRQDSCAVTYSMYVVDSRQYILRTC